jgi:hypothetical protein
MELRNPYSYTALEKPDETIRLIKMPSISPVICCEFSVVLLEDHLEFTTLSYMWGTSTAKDVVDIDGKTLQIHLSLANALRDIYHRWNDGETDTGAENWLWADGMCINQTDTEEKNHQVSLMGEMYSRARKMYSWLGADNERVRRIIDTFNLVPERSLNSQVIASY